MLGISDIRNANDIRIIFRIVKSSFHDISKTYFYILHDYTCQFDLLIQSIIAFHKWRHNCISQSIV